MIIGNGKEIRLKKRQRMIEEAIEKVLKEQLNFWQSIPDLYCPFCGRKTFHGGRWRWFEIGAKGYKEKILKCNECQSTQTYKYFLARNRKFTLIEITFSKGIL